uniref:Apple domain-containing protein n=1 Tax=Panagrolaimus sp. PS1159 TaxID=55785 RepID=A0AC35G9Y3_9BILA
MKYYLIFISFLTLVIDYGESRSLYLRCFQRVLRRSIDNSQPITELFYISPYQCLDQCILITNNAKQDGLCRSFVYNHLQHSCRLYSHDGRKIPAIIHPANGYDYYRRTAVTGECGGPLQRFYDAKANSNLKLVGAAPPSPSPPPPPPSQRKKIQSNVDPDGAPAARENFVVNEKSTANQLKPERDEFVIDETHSIQQSVKDLQPPPKKEFKEYSDVADPDYLDTVAGTRKIPKKQHSETQKQFDNNSDQALLEGFVKSVQHSKFDTRPGSSAGLPAGNGPPVHLPNNPSELGYENPQRPKPRPSQFELRPGSTGGLPGGNRRTGHPPNSPSELGYPENSRPTGRKPWSTRLPPATPAPPTRHTTPKFFDPDPTPSPFIETRPPPQPPSSPPPPPLSQPKSSRRSCQTSTGYYVVIGNEIILPVSGSENDVQVFHGVEQAKCAQFCSSNKGPGGENLHVQHSKFDTRPGSSAGLPAGNGPPVHLPNNPSELGYENPQRPKPRPSQFELRPGSTGGLPGGNRRTGHPPNSPSELGYPENSRPSGRKPWSTRLPPATPAPPTRHTTPKFFDPDPTPSPFIETRPPPQPPSSPPPPPPSPSQPKSSRRSCQTSTGYYVVIGNEIILPVSGSENDVQVFHGVEQAKCAQFCSSNKGPGGETLQCSSINYFPLQQKCEIYNILAEPHGPGSLVENDDVIYAEKFCLPSHRGNCQEDEIFILHVQKKVETKPLKVSSSNSITSCLQACLNANGCQSASFDSNHRRCSLHAASIGDNPDVAVETDPGWVLIENGCTTRRRKEKTFGVAKKSFNVDIEIAKKSFNVDIESEREREHERETEHEDPAFQWTEWSSCRFKIAGRQTVRVRTRKCKEKCADKGLQIERC